MKNEQKYEDMISILEQLHQYVPTVTTVHTSDVEGYGEIIKDDFHYILFGGDQLTTAWIRGSQRVCSCNDRGIDRLEGFQAAIEDWHAKGILLTVSHNITCIIARVL